MEIEIRKCSKIIGKATVLDEVEMKMKSGKIYGIKGKNGSGKTMLLRAVCGLILPTSGEILIDGEVLGKDISFPRSIGALIETPGFIAGYSGKKNLEVIAGIQNNVSGEEINQVMENVGVDWTDRKKYKKYSLGMKQKLGIAAAVMGEPELIILDEPTNALDEDSVKKLKEIMTDLKNKGALILFTCHDTEELYYLSDEVYYMENGRLKERAGGVYETEK